MKTNGVLAALIGIVLVAAAIVVGVKLRAADAEPEHVVAVPTAGDVSLVVIGIRGLDEDLVERLGSEGKLPNMTALIARGASGTYATLGRAVDERIGWTSLVTGTLPENQGVGGKKVSRRGDIIDAPLVPKSRTVDTIWTLLSSAGSSSGVVCWPGTWPVESIGGIMVGPHTTFVLERKQSGDPVDAVSPVEEYEFVDQYMRGKDEFLRRDLARFVNLDSVLGLEALVGQNYAALGDAYAADRSAVDLAEALVSERGIENLFVCLAGTDNVSQRFWHYMETEAIERLEVGESERRLLDGQIEVLGTTIDRYYVFVDELVGELVALAGAGATVALVADHGYSGITFDAAGQPRIGTHMHSEEGLWIIAGPGVVPGTTAEPGAIIDVAPTIMAAASIAPHDKIDGSVHSEVISR